MRKDNKIKTIAELSDSKLLYEKDMPPFGYVLLSLIVLILVAVVVWSTVTIKPYVVKAEGVIQSTNKNYVMSSYTGKITNVNMVEGQEVNEGDILFTVKNTDINMQKEQLLSQKESYQNTMAQYDKLIKSIKANTNYFDAATSEESLFYSQYEAYQKKMEQQILDEDALKNYGYTDEQIAREREKNESVRQEIYYSEITSAAGAKNQYQQEINQIDSQLEALDLGLLDHKVTAATSGTIHMLQNYKEGMVVQAASAVATIASEEENYVIEAYVASSDRSRIEEGNKVKIVVAGLQQNIYGTIPGKVISIDSDMTVEESRSYFKVRIEPERETLENKEGKEISISNGLPVEARITYEEITYFKYLLESLGI